MAKKLRRYKLQGLPKLSRAQVRVQNALLAHLAQTPFEKGFKDKLRALLEPLLHADIDVWFDGARALPAGELKRVVAQPSCLAIVGMPPRTDKALLEVDLAVAQMAIDKILGGSAEDADVQRPLSEIEDGVFSFVLLKVLHLMAGELEEKQLALRLDGLHGTVAQLQEHFAVDEPYVVLSFKLFFDLKVGFARVYLPYSAVQQQWTEAPPEPGPALTRSLQRLGDRVDLVRLLEAPLVVEVGRIGLAVQDLEALEEEDIILVEQTDVRLQAGEGDAPSSLTGRVHCKVGDGNHGVVSGALVVGDSGRYEVQIEAITPAGEPSSRAHLFRGVGSALGSGAEGGMSEHGRTPRGALVDVVAHARALREAQAARLLRAAVPGAPLLHGPAMAGEGEHAAPDDEEGGDEGPAPEAAGLLEDISVALVVELGRIQVSAADVVQLRAGQVIELSRAPGEPVDLVVDGKRIGKGELVEIDGELGVRILSLVK